MAIQTTQWLPVLGPQGPFVMKYRLQSTQIQAPINYQAS